MRASMIFRISRNSRSKFGRTGTMNRSVSSCCRASIGSTR